MCYAKPGPRCSRHAADALKAAIKSGDEAEIRKAKKDFALTPKGIAMLREQGKEEKADACLRQRNAMIAAYTEKLKYDELNQELVSRLESNEFKELIANRDETEATHKKLKEELGRLKADQNADFDVVREKTDEVKEAYFASLEAKQNLHEYKNETAHIVARISDTDEMKANEYTEDTLGNTRRMEEFPSNSREWLIQRQDGIGGSDVGGILKVDPKYGSYNYNRILKEKTTDFASMADDEFVMTEANENRAVNNAMQRGDAWEPVLVNVFAARNPEFKVMHTKCTWQNVDDPEMRANFDGLLSSREDGKPDGILEIKTSARPEDWENGVPDGYRAQVLHYLEATGLDYGYVAAQIDDTTYRQYRIERGEKINDRVGTINDNKQKLKDFMELARRVRNGEPMPAGRSMPAHPKIKYSEGPQSAEKVLAAYSGRSEEEIRQSIIARNTDDYDAAIRAEFAASKFTNQDTFSIDFETTGFSVDSSEVIEVGWTRRNARNEVIATGSSVYSPDPRFLRAKGTGAVDVHGITAEEVSGKTQFSKDKAAQAELMRNMQGAVLVAHNAPIEVSFLEQNVEGFHENKPKILDTALLSKYFDSGSPSNKLKDFTANNGIEYVGQHRGLKDSEMTIDSVFNFAEKNGQLPEAV